MLLLEGMTVAGRSVFTEREGGSDKRTVTIESWPKIFVSIGDFTVFDSIVGVESESALRGADSFFWWSSGPGSISKGGERQTI
jgi:hypothetical protein